MRSHLVRAWVVSASLLASSCDTRGATHDYTLASTGASPVAANPDASSTASRGVRFVSAPSRGDVAAWIHSAQIEAASRGRRVVVFVGAGWCPPCEAFHDAVDAHLLDASLPDLTLLEFDHDLDDDRLRAAGYTCRALPCFTAPGSDGRATNAHAEGVESIDAIVRQLRRLAGTRS